MHEEQLVYFVEVLSRLDNTIITDVLCGSDRDRALMEKDRLDLAWDDGSTYTRISEEWMTEQEIEDYAS